MIPELELDRDEVIGAAREYVAAEREGTKLEQYHCLERLVEALDDYDSRIEKVTAILVMKESHQH